MEINLEVSKSEDALHQIREMIADMAVTHASHIIVVGILRESSIIEGPCQIIDGILFVGDGSGDHFCSERVVQSGIEVGFDGEGFE